MTREPEDLAEVTTAETTAELDAAGDRFWGSVEYDREPADWRGLAGEVTKAEADDGDA